MAYRNWAHSSDDLISFLKAVRRGSIAHSQVRSAMKTLSVMESIKYDTICCGLRFLLEQVEEEAA